MCVGMCFDKCDDYKGVSEDFILVLFRIETSHHRILIRINYGNIGT